MLNIETASPFEEPPDYANGTRYFEWVAVSLAYVDALDEQPETTVLFCRGDWADEHTVDLFERVFGWTEARDVDRVLTDNGAWFDVTHLSSWARELGDAAGSALLDRPMRSSRTTWTWRSRLPTRTLTNRRELKSDVRIESETPHSDAARSSWRYSSRSAGRCAS